MQSGTSFDSVSYLQFSLYLYNVGIKFGLRNKSKGERGKRERRKDAQSFTHAYTHRYMYANMYIDT